MKNNKSVNIQELFKIFAPCVTKSDIYLANIYSKIALEIVKRRVSTMLSEKEFAKNLGISKRTLLKLEQGKYNFTIEFLTKLCEKLQLTLDIIVENE